MQGKQTKVVSKSDNYSRYNFPNESEQQAKIIGYSISVAIITVMPCLVRGGPS